MNDHLSLTVLGWIGIYAPVALGAIGAMMEVNSGYGRFVGLSA